MLSVMHARELIRVAGADLLARALSSTTRGRLFRLAAIAALVAPASTYSSVWRWRLLCQTGWGVVESNVIAAACRFRGLPCHSWSDDGEAKYAALSCWAAELDKACIDQDSIDASLLGLPIYVSGCTHLLVLDGPSYATRLWCIMEIFCFMLLLQRHVRAVRRTWLLRSPRRATRVLHARYFAYGSGLRITGGRVNCEETSLTTVDEMLAQWQMPHISVVKVDVEGFECSVLAGAQTLFTTIKPRVIHAELKFPEVERCWREQAKLHGYHVGPPKGKDKNTVLTRIESISPARARLESPSLSVPKRGSESH
ncbi:hypothetical protein EMIHUDRAFT_232922 [Emiliania huxleyi CCMP1516]|uniref:Methyltransferase FkbM domain-containing protein n=2 Tax=Emiliania huxleyi TaxID=2903 RepID=A0A0D3K3R8_EMIH1|nr:hypothetical protein EMIHUDRAFT_232922 [Emiliania huxleyi CCMP1516]EOD30403.1 hypothetical protein EMIHUDRAFT_232922 [Emiliania huxleyi CCMP1516]|eukprot:XP_005782832.1 hypothetical protein EMIHUDRAFT_232922 [Emiliania huxleyi CCMP1516]